MNKARWEWSYVVETSSALACTTQSSESIGDMSQASSTHLEVRGIFGTNDSAGMVEVDSQIGVVGFDGWGHVFNGTDVEGCGMSKDGQNNRFILLV